MSSILPKNERWGNFMYRKMPKRSFFGRIQVAKICFRDLLTFRVNKFLMSKQPALFIDSIFEWRFWYTVQNIYQNQVLGLPALRNATENPRIPVPGIFLHPDPRKISFASPRSPVSPTILPEFPENQLSWELFSLFFEKWYKNLPLNDNQICKSLQTH